VSEVDDFCQALKPRFKPSQDRFEDRIAAKLRTAFPDLLRECLDLSQMSGVLPVKMAARRFRNSVPIFEIATRYVKTPLHDAYQEALDTHGYPDAAEYVALAFTSTDLGDHHVLVLHNATDRAYISEKHWFTRIPGYLTLTSLEGFIDGIAALADV